MGTFTIAGNKFYLNGKPFQIISGAVHYFRNMPDTWRDIFKKMRACGCNTVETYCVWNMHEKTPGNFDFEGMLDVARFLRIAGEEGLYAIVRPGPYICAEWEFGGLPWWLQNEADLEIRCSNPQYMARFMRYIGRLFQEISPLLITNGGNILMVQCENEYGYYGDDKIYLNSLRDAFRTLGIDVPLFTSDGTAAHNILDGCIDGCLATLNFGSRVEENFAVYDKLFPNSPKMCMECWDGWFDAWGDEKHHTTSAAEYAKVIDAMLKRGSVNMYMFIGGTNFGFTSGANHYETFAPDVTSYDYDALLSECGDTTEKYFAVRNVLQNYVQGNLPPVPPNAPKRAYGSVVLAERASLFGNLFALSRPQRSDVPKPMEAYGQGYGYILYRTTLGRRYENAELSFERIGDRAHVFLGGACVATLYVNDKEYRVKFSAEKGATLSILCENMGRTNFGAKMMYKKGIVGRCLIDEKIHFGWEVYPLPMDALSSLNFGSAGNTAAGDAAGGNEASFNTADGNGAECGVPAFYRGKFFADDRADTFLLTENFKKGFVTINGFNLGRYWEIGPQKTLFVPKYILRQGENEIILFETDGLNGEPRVELIDRAILG